MGIRNSALVVLLLFFGSAVWASRTPTHKRHHYRNLRVPRIRRQWVAFPPSRESLRAQNALIDEMGYERIADERQLNLLVEQGKLVSITDNQYVQLSRKLPKERAYLRPTANDFLQQLGKDFYDQFGFALQVNSAVRPISVQKRLRRSNRNAAAVSGEFASSHMAGATFDLQRRGLNRRQIRFIELRLLVYSSERRVLIEEEQAQPCFHIMVGYVHPVETKTSEIPLELLPETPTEIGQAVIDKRED